VRLARRVGETLGDYDLVMTSEMPRAIETAIAMGYRVDRYATTLGSMLLADTEVDWTLGWSGYAEAAKHGGITHHAAQSHADLLRKVATDLSADGRALLVSHGGVLELGVVGLLPDYDFGAWGPIIERCEGVRLYFDGDRCTGAEIMRIAQLLPET
jgi:broad specificity phosphatase PhoE